MKKKDIPNILSLLRILAAIAFPFVFFSTFPNVIPAMILFVAAGATDVMDGYLARRYNWISDTGKVMDPIADKLMQAMVLVCMSIKSIIPVWLTVVCIIKELAVLGGSAIILGSRHTVVVSKWCGKLAVCVFYAAMFALSVFRDSLNAFASNVIYVITLLTALMALAFYMPVFIRHVKTAKTSRNTDGSVNV